MSYEGVKTALFWGLFGLLILTLDNCVDTLAAVVQQRAGSAALSAVAALASLLCAVYVGSVWWHWRQVAAEAKRARR